MSKQLPIAIVVVAVLGAGLWWLAAPVMGPGGEEAALPQIAVAEVTEAATDGLTVTGLTDIAEDIVVPAPLRGALLSFDVTEGAAVEEGQVLAQLEHSAQQAELMAALAEVELAEAELERGRELAGEGLADAEETAALESTLEAAIGEQAAAEAAIEAYVIRAPFAGRVSFAGLEVGDIVQADQPLLTITSAAESMVRFELARRLATELTIAQTLDISGQLPDGGDAFDARAQIVAMTTVPGGDRPTTSILLRVVDAPVDLPAGLDVEVTIPVEVETAALVPENAVVDAATGTQVFRIEQGLARATPVEVTDAAPDGRLRVRGSLAPGDIVAVSALDQLSDGVRVNVANDEG